MTQKEINDKEINIKIISKRFSYSEALLDKNFKFRRDKVEDSSSEEDTIEVFTTGVLRDLGGRIEIRYEESDATGMGGSMTSVSFERQNRDLVSVLRKGTFDTALIFEEGKRHICAYETPYMPIEICVVTQSLANKMNEGGGSIELDYFIESGGMKSERTKLSFEVEFPAATLHHNCSL